MTVMGGHQQPAIRTDQFSKSIDISGGSTEVENASGLREQRSQWLIRSWVDKETRESRHQIYWDTSYYGDWHFYESASDEEANPHAVVTVDRRVISCADLFPLRSGCEYSETVGIDIGDYFLRSHAGGFRIKLSSRGGGSVVIVVPPEAVSKQLALLAQVGARASGPSEPASKGAAIGVMLAPTPPALANMIQLDRPRGLFVGVVVKAGPAEKAGIQAGDVILECDDHPTDTPAQIHAILSDSHASVSCKLWSVSGAKDNKPVYSEKVVTIALGGPRAEAK